MNVFCMEIFILSYLSKTIGFRNDVHYAVLQSTVQMYGLILVNLVCGHLGIFQVSFEVQGSFRKYKIPSLNNFQCQPNCGCLELILCTLGICEIFSHPSNSIFQDGQFLLQFIGKLLFGFSSKLCVYCMLTNILFMLTPK